jgi:CheY-like chemotaxis protein
MRRIRALPTASELRAIAITAHITDEHRSRAFAAGFDRFLLKPIDLPVLLEMIAELAR